jgi:hypothetical protein
MRILAFFLLVTTALNVRAEVVECDNGDRYNGKILSVDETSVKLQNDIAGTLTIPRSRIVGIHFRQTAATPPPVTVNAATNRPALDPNKLQFDPASIERIQNEYFADATPEARQMFQEMVHGVQSGQINLHDVQVQAATALKELREAQKELSGGDTSGILDAYAEILEAFLNQAPSTVRASPVTPAKPQPKVR